jgi:hypothetical protein
MLSKNVFLVWLILLLIISGTSGEYVGPCLFSRKIDFINYASQSDRQRLCCQAKDLKKWKRGVIVVKSSEEVDNKISVEYFLRDRLKPCIIDNCTTSHDLSIFYS